MNARSSMIRLQRFQVEEKQRQLTQMGAMIDDLEKMVAELNSQVEKEQNRCGVHDINHFAYPTFARAALIRKENMEVTIQELNAKRDSAREDLEEAYVELKKFETVEQRALVSAKRSAAAAEQKELDEHHRVRA